jgi:thiol-disulfide isomerase/thioredoxin
MRDCFFSFVSTCRMAQGIAAAAIFAVLAGCSEAPPAKPEIKEGKPFPAIAMVNASGNALEDPAFRGKLLILNVWATWCPPCRREMPGLERLSKMLDPERFVVLGMSTDQDERLAAEFLMQNGITFFNFFDQNARLSREWELKVYPETFLIAPDGKLIRRIAGLREWDSPEMVAELEAAYQQHQGKAGAASFVK